MKFLNDFKTVIGTVIALIAIVGWTLNLERSVAKKSELINSQIVQMEMVKIVALAPHGGKYEDAPPDVRAICDMVNLVSMKLRGE